MGKALYRKYRSKSLDEIVGQPHITTTLKNSLSSDTVSHAYLFTGPRGVGKTSIARILAHEVNKLPYTEESTHLDIIEIDAASNRRIDEIRELRERVHSAPTSAKYKVYIIDEVHMLTKEAFNALLKTLEEPPDHVIFILATTEAHKLPETIVSRTQRLIFKPVDQKAVVDHLRYIAKQESIEVSDEALQLIADHGQGSFRDSISLLDQSKAHSNPVTLNDVENILGIAPERIVTEILYAVAKSNPQIIVTTLSDAASQGYQPSQLAKQLAAKLRLQLLNGENAAATTTTLLRQLIEVPASHDSFTALELALLEATILQKPADNSTQQSTPKPTLPLQKDITKPILVAELKPEPLILADKAPVEKPSKHQSAKIPESTKVWDQVLVSIKQRYNTLYSVARMAEATIDGDDVTLSFAFAFHQKRINETKNKQIIASTFETVLGRPITLFCLTIDKTKKQPVLTSKKSADTIATISNIFGGAEVLE